MYKIGIDVGGTFTDFVVVKNNEAPRYFKQPSTPQDPSEGVISGLAHAAAAYGQSTGDLLGETELIIHGTTVATNTLVERKGARVGLITTDGFRDLLEMREGLKEDRYNLRMTPLEPLVPRYLRLGVVERVCADGSVESELDEASLSRAIDSMKSEGVEAVAICFLFSYLNPDHERRAAKMVREAFPDTYTSVSHEILPQIKEFDRLSTTVVNTYVGPVFADYLSRLRQRLAAYDRVPEILIMQSNGGVASIADSVSRAVRAILSGPAGGVSGASHYGGIVGERKVIGFDMGGTSTDISLIEDGAPHVTSEKFEAGWKIAVPMIDIHTLGAGGGSIAWVDAGGILRVGPESAGSDPGPACYATGGRRPTVTDANLLLGYLGAESFLGGRTRLDADAATVALDEQVARPLGLTTAKAAYGIHQLVSSNIAEGIRLASVKRGVDPREFAIVAFGGASGLHVSSVARQLRVENVYVPSAAPVLSALGMLSTDLQYDFSRSHSASLEDIDLGAVRSIMGELEREGVAKLRAQGVKDAEIEVVRTADMRYLDQVYEVNVPVPDLDRSDPSPVEEWMDSFHRRYEELYSYQQSEQEIRLVTLRVSVLGRLPKVDPPRADEGPRDVAVEKERRQIFLGDWRDAPVYATDRLPVGQEITGPAVLESEFTTILVEPGDRARVDEHGGIRLSVGLEPAGNAAATAPDPITLAVVENRLESIALEMMEVMLRTSMSQILNSSRDFSTCILDADCQLVAQGEGIPVHISALPIAGAAVRDYFAGDMADGDLFALNDPYFGGSHLPDLTVIKPIFYEGKLLFYSVNRAHHSDVGGGTHGGYNPSASEIFHEGLRIPPLRLHDKGKPRRDVLQMMAANGRHPESFLGDLNAQIGSVNIAERRMRALLDAYGPELLLTTVKDIIAATERQVRGFISEWPDGVYKGESFVDDDGFDSKMIPIRATVTIDGDQMTIDLSDSHRQVTGFINSAYANTRSLAHAAIMYMAPSDVAKNEGSMRPVTVIAPRGLIVNANPPAPVCMSTNHCAEEVVEAIFKALSAAVPDAVNAGFSRRLRYAITGVDPRTGRTFLWHFFLARGGGGASRGFDGWTNVGEVNVVGGIRSPSIEVTEDRFPFFIHRHELRPDSAGEGEWRGGLGAVCDLEYRGEGVASLNMAGDGVVVPPFGLFGGEPGQPHRYKIVSNGADRPLKSKETGVVVKPGDRIVCLSSGGGGYGDPRRRAEQSAQSDLKNGYRTEGPRSS